MYTSWSNSQMMFIDETNFAPYFSEISPMSGLSVETQISSKQAAFCRATMVHAIRGCPFNIFTFFPGIPLLPRQNKIQNHLETLQFLRIKLFLFHHIAKNVSCMNSQSKFSPQVKHTEAIALEHLAT